MSKWRPVPRNCLYIVGDIHGQYKQLQRICNRIFPLRKSDGGKDIAVFLGDYIDRLPESHLVIDFLIEAKKKYKDQLVLLRGNHEEMLLRALKPAQTSFYYRLWMNNGGSQTLSGYLERANQPMENPFLLPRFRVPDFVPKEHIEFFNSLKSYYETDDYIFVHGGCDPTVPLDKQEENELLWDRGLFEVTVREYVLKKQQPPWPKTIVTGHNGNEDGEVLITDKFMMLDCSYARQLMVLELNSMEAFVAKKNNARLVKLQLKDRLAV